MLDAALKQQLSQYLAMLREPIELVATLGADAKSTETRELLEAIASLSDKVTATYDGRCPPPQLHHTPRLRRERLGALRRRAAGP